MTKKTVHQKVALLLQMVALLALQMVASSLKMALVMKDKFNVLQVLCSVHVSKLVNMFCVYSSTRCSTFCYRWGVYNNLNFFYLIGDEDLQ